MNARAAVYLAFAGLGITTATFPALIPARAAADGEQVLLAAPMLFFGLLIGVLVTTAVGARLRPTRIAGIGSAIQAVALIAILVSPGAIGFIAAALIGGLGFGVSEAAGNLIARAAAQSAGTAGLLARLTGVVAVVAATVPLLFAVAAVDVWRIVLVIALAAGHAVTGALLWRSPLPVSRPASKGARLGQRTTLLVVAVTLALFVGVESVFAGWSAVFGERLAHLSPTAASIATTMYWGVVAVGRFGFAVLVHRGHPPRRTFILGMILATVLLGVAATVRDTAPLVALGCIAIVVATLATGYAALVGIGLDTASDAQAPRVVGILVACGATGGTAIPALLLATTGDPTAMAALLICAALTAVIAVMSGVVASRLASVAASSHGS
ncbi:MFS transporter [Microbacterium sp. ZW T5_56]|uniref:MFS transporter n=1 Tax=Microbacterium sp. ZW T5_56 TaxID=3378081 RepID=UPI003851D697